MISFHCDGPQRLLFELKCKTAAFHQTLAGMQHCRKVAFAIPREVLEGDIRLFLSRRLQELVAGYYQADKDPAIDLERPKRKISDIEPLVTKTTRIEKTLQPEDTMSRLPSPPAQNSELERSSPWQPLPAQSAENFPQPDTGHKAGRNMKMDNLKQTEPADRYFWHRFIPKNNASRTGSIASPLLLARLDEYWHLLLAEAKQKNTPDALPATARHAVHESPAAPIGLVPSFRRWPEATGQWLTERIAETSDQEQAATSRAGLSQIVDKTRNVEISNIFNIDVKMQNDGHMPSDNLSEKIAAILREQAMQHGIDIT
jgi:hypothetical protein